MLLLEGSGERSQFFQASSFLASLVASFRPIAISTRDREEEGRIHARQPASFSHAGGAAGGGYPLQINVEMKGKQGGGGGRRRALFFLFLFLRREERAAAASFLPSSLPNLFSLLLETIFSSHGPKTPFPSSFLSPPP